MRSFIVRLIFISIIFFIGSGRLLSQADPVDSLQNLLKKISQDTSRVDLLNQLSTEYRNRADYPTAKAYALQALNLSEKIFFAKGKANTYKTLGNIYYEQGEYPKALEFYFGSLKIRDSLKDSVGIASILTNIGNNYYNQLDTTKAIENYNKAIAIYEKLGMQNTARYLNALLGMGAVYEAIGDLDKAFDCYLKTKEIANQLNDEDGVAISLNNLGNLYKTRKEYKEAIRYYRSSLVIRERIGDQYGETTTLHNIGAIYHAQKEDRQALPYAEKSLQRAKEIEAPDLAKDASLLLSEIYDNLGDKTKALQHLKIYYDIRDSLFSAEKMKNVAYQESKMKEDKMEADFKEEQIKKEAQIKQQKIISLAFTAGFVFVLVLIFVVFRNLKQSREHNRIIAAQKSEVEQKNIVIEHKQQEILDSITYARRIQHALLASNDLLNENLNDYFVLFKPKDIVSGDFYWATRTEDAFYLATADSTGHGVPGAFMSLLNISFLNEAINEKKIKEPGAALNQVRTNLIKALRTDGSEEGGKDGMDCILTAFDFKNDLLHYAAANNGFYIVREKELQALKADKMPVGKSPRDAEPFTSHAFQLQKGDIIYTLTDGYADQFGGPKGKKFKYKPLEELLLTNSHLPMEEQKQHLLARFDEWKGDLEQVDDVLIIGVRV
jgi:serine phosphatase RsbU (regulator of sigma subunit)